MRKWILVVAVLLVLVGVGAWQLRTRWQRTKQEGLVLYGNVDIREVSLGFRVAGRIAEILRDEGDVVKAGELLARLDDEPYRREMDEARAQVAALRARLQLLEAGHRPEEVAQARALLREREVTARNAERLFKRQEELLGRNAVSVQDRDDAEARFREAEARLKSAQEQAALAEAGFRTEEIAQAKAELARAEAMLASAALRVEDAALKSPADGIILTRAQEPGAVLPAGTTVLTVSMVKPVWVRTYVQESQLGRLHPGQKVQVFTDSRPGHGYSGQIGYLSPRAEFTPKNVETPELRTSLVYRLRVVVDHPDDGLRQGMPVTVRVPSG